MPFVSGEEWRRVNDANADLAQRLHDWEALGPFLDIARQLQSHVVELLATDATTEEVGRLAYMSVMTAQAEKARNEVAAKYEQEHRRTLYEQVLKEIEAKEGSSIMADVVTRLETDTTLALELHESARKELTARAKGVIAEQVTTEQARIIDAETDRQIALDRFDVAFALSGRQDLGDKALAELIKPGDKLAVMFGKDTVGQSGLLFTWTQDINNAMGWTLTEPIKESKKRFYTEYSKVPTGTIPQDRFVVIGTQMPDLVGGHREIKTDTIVAGHPLAISWWGNNGEEGNHVVQTSVRDSEYAHSNVNKVPPIASIDFRTRDLQFVQQ
jgi:hypothetical protein